VTVKRIVVWGTGFVGKLVLTEVLNVLRDDVSTDDPLATVPVVPPL
jgi:hypothetical protein